MNATQLFQSEHFFVYKTTKPISAAMLAESLVGLDGLVIHGARVLATLLETPVKSNGVLIKKIEFGSYKEDIIIRLLFGRGKTMEKNLEKFRAKTGLTHMQTRTLITLALVLALGYGAYRFAVAKGDEKTILNITNSFNSWGGEIGKSGPEIMRIVSAGVTNPADLQRQIVRLTRPKGTADNGDVSFDGDSKRTVPAEIIAIVPNQIADLEPEEPVKDYENEQIVIRAADLDRPSTGWFGIAPAISDKRVAVQLEDGIDPAKVVLGKYNNADITVMFEIDKQGTRHPKKYLIRKLHAIDGK